MNKYRQQLQAVVSVSEKLPRWERLRGGGEVALCHAGQTTHKKVHLFFFFARKKGEKKNHERTQIRGQRTDFWCAWDFELLFGEWKSERKKKKVAAPQVARSFIMKIFTKACFVSPLKFAREERSWQRWPNVGQKGWWFNLCKSVLLS